MSASNVLVSTHSPSVGHARYEFTTEDGRDATVDLPDLGVCAALHDYDLSHAADEPVEVPDHPSPVMRACRGLGPGGPGAGTETPVASMRNALIEGRVFEKKRYATEDPLVTCSRALVPGANRSFDAYFLLHSLRRACLAAGDAYKPIVATVDAAVPELAAGAAAPKYSAVVRPWLYPATLATDVVAPLVARLLPAATNGTTGGQHCHPPPGKGPAAPVRCHHGKAAGAATTPIATFRWAPDRRAALAPAGVRPADAYRLIIGMTCNELRRSVPFEVPRGWHRRRLVDVAAACELLLTSSSGSTSAGGVRHASFAWLERVAGSLHGRKRGAAVAARSAGSHEVLAADLRATLEACRSAGRVVVLAM
jgi:hypothetical protein